jgi:hypothetical protein
MLYISLFVNILLKKIYKTNALQSQLIVFIRRYKKATPSTLYKENTGLIKIKATKIIVKFIIAGVLK